MGGVEFAVGWNGNVGVGGCNRVLVYEVHIYIVLYTPQSRP